MCAHKSSANAHAEAALAQYTNSILDQDGQTAVFLGDYGTSSVAYNHENPA